MKRSIAVGLTLVVVLAALSGCTANVNDTVDDNQSISESILLLETIPFSSAEEPENSFPDDDAMEEIPSHEWEVDSPENHGMDVALLQQLHNALNGRQMLSSVTVKDGCIVDEYYKDGDDATSVFTFQSGSKSFTGALVGIAIDEDYIAGLDISIAEYFPQVIGTDKDTVTIHHLLSAIVEQATGESLMEYGRRYIFEPLGMDSVVWDTDSQGITDGGNGISMTARDAAKFGQLYLDGGNWKFFVLVLWILSEIDEERIGPLWKSWNIVPLTPPYSTMLSASSHCRRACTQSGSAHRPRAAQGKCRLSQTGAAEAG